MAYAMGYRSVAAPRLDDPNDLELSIKAYPRIHNPEYSFSK
jgi:hypothetical protein